VCGIIVGYSKNWTEEDLLEFMMRLKDNEKRGGDSVGVWIDSASKVIYSYTKSADLVIRSLWENRRAVISKETLLMGHTRKTATGSKKDYHPVVTKKVVIVHNGVVNADSFDPLKNDTYEWARVLSENPNFKKAEWITTTACIHFRGIEETYIVKSRNPLYQRKRKGLLLLSSVEFIDSEEVKDGNYMLNAEKVELTETKRKFGDSIIRYTLVSKYKEYWWDEDYYNKRYGINYISKGKEKEKDKEEKKKGKNKEDIKKKYSWMYPKWIF